MIRNSNQQHETRHSKLIRRGIHSGGGPGVLSESTNTKGVVVSGGGGNDVVASKEAAITRLMMTTTATAATTTRSVSAANRISTDSVGTIPVNDDVNDKDTPTPTSLSSLTVSAGDGGDGDGSPTNASSSGSSSASSSPGIMLIHGKGKFHTQSIKLRMKNLQEKQQQRQQQQEERRRQSEQVLQQLDELEKDLDEQQQQQIPSPSKKKNPSAVTTTSSSSSATSKQKNQNKNSTSLKTAPTLSISIPNSSSPNHYDPSPLSMEDPWLKAEAAMRNRRSTNSGGQSGEEGSKIVRDSLAVVQEMVGGDTEEDDDGKYDHDDYSRTSSSVNPNNISAWAMMEHYHVPNSNNDEKNMHSEGRHHSSSEKVVRNNNFMWYDEGSRYQDDDDEDGRSGGDEEDDDGRHFSTRSSPTSKTIEYHNEMLQKRQSRPLLSPNEDVFVPPMDTWDPTTPMSNIHPQEEEEDRYQPYGDSVVVDDRAATSEEEDYHDEEQEDNVEHDEHHSYWQQQQNNATRANSSTTTSQGGDTEIIASHEYLSPDIHRRYSGLQQVSGGRGRHHYVEHNHDAGGDGAGAGDYYPNDDGSVTDEVVYDRRRRSVPAAEVSPATVEWDADDLDDSLGPKSPSLSHNPRDDDVEGLPTPAQIRFEWEAGASSRDGRRDDDGDNSNSSPPTSLFQEATILSSQQSSNVATEEDPHREDEDGYVDDNSSYDSTYSPSQNTETQLSTVSLQESVSGHGFYEPPTASSMVTTPNTLASTPGGPNAGANSNNENSPPETLLSPTKEQVTYLARIEELEQTLKEQRRVNEHEQTKLLDRVSDLENKLRSATPRSGVGTTSSAVSGVSKGFFGSGSSATTNIHNDQNPINTLLERNKTLVKEVRFADQTCVELSSQNSALETQISLLQEQLSKMEREKELLLQNQHRQNNFHSQGHNRKAKSSTPQSLGSISIAGSAISSHSSLGPIPEDEQLSLGAEDGGDAIDQNEPMIAPDTGNGVSPSNRITDNNVSVLSMDASSAWIDDELLTTILDDLKSEVIGTVREMQKETQPQEFTGPKMHHRFRVNDDLVIEGVSPDNNENVNLGAPVAATDGEESVTSHFLAKALQLQIQRLQKEQMKDAQETSSTSSNDPDVPDGSLIHMTTHQRLLDGAREEIQVLKTKLDELKAQKGSPSSVGLPATIRELRRQLTSALHDKEQALDDLNEAEEKFEQERQQKDKEISTLGEQVDRLTKHIYLYGDGPTSPRLKKADKHVFDLEKDLTHAKADIVSLQNAAAEKQKQGDKTYTATVKILQEGLTRIYSQYEKLEGAVDRVTEEYARRLEQLTVTVTNLKSSFRFELDSDSVSTQLQQRSPHQGRDQDDTLHRMMSATIRGQRSADATDDVYSVPDPTDDELLELMEEARSPIMSPSGSRRSQVRDGTPLSRQLDDTMTAASEDNQSRSVTVSVDDGTLDSLLKQASVSIGSPVSGMNHRDDPKLHALLEEFHRVRDQLAKMQDILKSQQANMNRLETENGRLSLEASRRVEEKGLVQQALSQAKERLEELQFQLETSQNELQEAVSLSLERANTIDTLSEEKSTLTLELDQTSKRATGLATQLEMLEEAHADLDRQYAASQESLDMAEQHVLLLESQLSTKEEECSAMAKIEHDRLAKDLASCKSQLQVVEADMQQVVLDRNLCQSKVNELESALEATESNAEDKVLSAQCKLENVRTERAELKAKIVHLQAELSSTKESLGTAQQRLLSKTHERDSILESLNGERSQAAHHAGELAVLRQELHDLLDSINPVDEFGSAFSPPRQKSTSSSLHNSRTSHPNTPSDVDDLVHQSLRISSLNQEVGHWKDIMPSLVSSLQSLRPTQTRLSQMEEEAATMIDRLQGQQAALEEFSKHSEEVRSQNETLLKMLRHAEQEVDKTSEQYQQLTSTIDTLNNQQEEDRGQLDRLLEIKSELESALDSVTREYTTAKENLKQLQSLLAQKESKISEMAESLSTTQQQLSKCNDKLSVCDTEKEKLLTKIVSMENKCSKLRDYIRKLTSKCEEWEISYEKQSERLEKHDQRHRETRKKASEIARRYQKLVNDVERRKKVHLEDQEKWKFERSNAEQVHTQLEMELEEIAKELSNIDVLWSSPIPR